MQYAKTFASPAAVTVVCTYRVKVVPGVTPEVHSARPATVTSCIFIFVRCLTGPTLRPHREDCESITDTEASLDYINYTVEFFFPTVLL